LSDPIFGIAITQVNDDPRPAVGSDMAIVGLLCTAQNANASRFPIDEPVEVFSDDTTLLTDLGELGTAFKAIDGINDQLGEFQVAARIVIVRVTHSATPMTVISNMIGNASSKTGIHAFKKAGEALGVIPRLITAPEYTHQVISGVASIDITNHGTSYETRPSVGITGGGAGVTVNATAIAKLFPTTVASVTVVDGGTGYDSDELVITPSGGDLAAGGVHAVFSATVVDGVITAITVEDGGEGYTDVPTLTITQPGFAGDPASATAVLTSTTVDRIVVTNPGQGYSVAPSVAITGGGGSSAAATGIVDTLANGLVAEAPSVLDTLLAHAVFSGPSDSLVAFTNWRETIQSRRIIPLASGAKVQRGELILTEDAAPRIIGIGVRRDHEFQGRPFHSWANQPVQGIVGPNRNIEFSLTDGATEGQQILSQNGGVILRGQMGVETAIASGGFVYVGTDTCSEDPLWTFYNVTRGRDYIHLLFLKTLRFYLGRFNITAQTIESILSTMTIALRNLQADGDILGFKVGFRRDQNSPDQLRLGKFTVDFAAEEAPVLRYIGIRSQRYERALEFLLDDLLSQLEV